jgi:predicted TIM-barrel fold metal-dependent hydrolase
MNVIDCDLHPAAPNILELEPYLPDYWREYTAQTAFKGPIDSAYPPTRAISSRPDYVPAGGWGPGSDLDMLRAQALDAWGTRLGILNCAYAVESVRNPYGTAALASAANDWLIASWLDKEPRLRASLIVPIQQPDLAVKEIDRLGGHPGFVQVLLPARSEALYGNRRYHPVYEAALRHDLAIGIHFGGFPGNPPTPAGWPSYYIEEYAGMAHIFQSQVMNLIAEGIFEQFPDLRVALLESGFTWLPPFTWRIDKEWKGIRREIPWVKRPPSEYIRQHVRISLQPLDAPPAEAQFQQVFEQSGAEDLLMFSTDYPHWHFDTPNQAVPNWLSEAARHKIMHENAGKFYKLG